MSAKKLVVLVGAVLALSVASLLAVTGGEVHAATQPPSGPVTVTWTGNGTTNGVCNDISIDSSLSPGTQVWQFNLTRPFGTGPWTLSATFTPDGVKMAAGMQQGMGAVRFTVTTTAGAILTSASATNGQTNSVLTVGQCTVPPAQVTVAKDCPGATGGMFSFTITGSNGTTYGPTTVACGGSVGPVRFAITSPITVTVTETVDPGFTLVSITCTKNGGLPVTTMVVSGGVSFTMNPGDDITCTATNQRILRQGCTPGYWKNHTGSWPPTGYSPSQFISSAFSGASAFPSLASQTLLAGLDFGGGPGTEGAAEILLRAGIAALLNAAHPGVTYPRTEASVIADVNMVLGSNNRDTMLALAAMLDANNNLGCPLN